jgi:hypothetical protein
MPRSQITGPIPLSFSQESFDWVIENKNDSLIYLGYRPATTFDLHQRYYGEGKSLNIKAKIILFISFTFVNLNSSSDSSVNIILNIHFRPENHKLSGNASSILIPFMKEEI